MVEIILLIVGVIYSIRRPKLKKLKVEEFPNVDPAKFIEWQKAAIKATDAFLWATWGAFIIKLVITLTLRENEWVVENPLLFMGIILGLWLVGLMIAATYGTKAKKLQKASAIRWH